MKSVFVFSSYKSVMAYRLTGKERHGQLTKAAHAMNCQRSYLSRVISEDLHITPDHAFNLAGFWDLSSDERIYFQTLVEYERAADINYRTHLKGQLKELKARHESIQERTKRTDLSIDTHQANYFSNWIWSAIHFLTSISDYQNVDTIGDRLGLKKESVLYYLKHLESQGFIENIKDRWVYKTGDFHAPKSSPLVVLHHQNWRARAVMDAQNFESTNVHFTGVHTISRSDFDKIKELLLAYIGEATQIIGPSKPEEAIALTCDLFQI